MKVINEQDYPLLHKYTNHPSVCSSISTVLEIEANVGVDNRPALIEEIHELCKDRFLGCAIFGDPMGDPGVTYVFVQGKTWQEAQDKVKDHPIYGLKGQEAMWGCHGLFWKYEKAGSCYFAKWEEDVYPISVILGPERIDFWEDILEREIRHYDLCKDCLHLRWQHARKQCREDACPCTSGYDNIETVM